MADCPDHYGSISGVNKKSVDIFAFSVGSGICLCTDKEKTRPFQRCKDKEWINKLYNGLWSYAIVNCNGL